MYKHIFVKPVPAHQLERCHINNFKSRPMTLTPHAELFLKLMYTCATVSPTPATRLNSTHARTHALSDPVLLATYKSSYKRLMHKYIYSDL